MIYYAPENLKYARENRKQRNATRQEGILWHVYLSKAKCRFYRQYRAGNYILDFYCPKKHLAIEIDGSQHYEATGVTYDEERSRFLNGNGIAVLRFSNYEIDRQLYAVICRIKSAIGEE